MRFETNAVGNRRAVIGRVKVEPSNGSECVFIEVGSGCVHLTPEQTINTINTINALNAVLNGEFDKPKMKTQYRAVRGGDLSGYVWSGAPIRIETREVPA